MEGTEGFKRSIPETSALSDGDRRRSWAEMEVLGSGDKEGDPNFSLIVSGGGV